MRISIRIKFSVFLALLLLLTVAVLSLLVLSGVKEDQRRNYEDFLAQQVRVANLHFTQSYFSESYINAEDFLNSRGKELADQLGMISNRLVVLYDMDGREVGSSIPSAGKVDIKDTIEFALDNKSAYQVEGDSLYYLAPLKIEGNQVGVIQLFYSLKPHKNFYNNIKYLFFAVGAFVFVLSFILGFTYFNTFSSGILKLKKNTDRIRKGEYNIPLLSRRDELGELSQGIYYMSNEIKKNIEGMHTEQDKLRLAVQKLSALEKQQKQFIGNISHEFKTPLTSIKAYLDLLEMYPDDPKLLGDAKSSISHETMRLYDMVEKVLYLSSMEKYDFELNMEKLEVSHLVESVLGRMKGKIEKFGLRLETDLQTSYILADRELMDHILINLFDNAIKYNKYGGKISVRNYQDGDTVYVEVGNTGLKIPSGDKQRIFEPFYRADKNRSRQTGGSGLGLALVKELVEKQHGTIELKKSDGEENIFIISFPLCR